MIAWQRRRLILGGLLTLLPGWDCRALNQEPEYSGCWLDTHDSRAFQQEHLIGGSQLAEPLVSQSGVPGLEGALVQTLSMLAEMFGVLPGFSYYRENGDPNAKATSVDLLKGRPDGTVLVGLKLLRNLLAIPEHPGAAVVAVCAHEFAHIVSYSSGAILQLAPSQSDQPFRSEQFADYIAGYFAGRRKLDRPDFPAVVFASTASMYGGATHGTAEQRGNAVQEGFLTAYIRKAEPQAAIRRAVQFALAEQP